MMNLSEFVGEQLKQRGWSMRELSYRIECSPMTISDIVTKGHIPSDDILQRLADELDVSMAFLHQISGYSWTREDGLDGEAKRLARMMAHEPLMRELWAEIETSPPGLMQRALEYLRFLKSSV
jgi:transcriptional regulator with XRE-family HTH domain